MKKRQNIGMIRQRGQLTIPDAIRQSVHWLTENGVVLITMVTPREIRLEPYEGKKKTLDWKDLRERLEYVRSLPGKKIKLSQFVLDDRKKRR